MVVVFIVVYILAREALRRYYNARYEGFFATAHYQEALDTLDALPARVTMTTYQQYSRRFFCYEAMENKEMATRMIELMVRMRHAQKRQVQVLTMAFNYYVQIGEKNRAKELLAQLKTCKAADKAVIQDCQLTYDIVFGKRYDYIEQMEQMLPGAAPELKGKLCFLHVDLIDGLRPDAVLIMLLPPSFAVQEQRLRGRGIRTAVFLSRHIIFLPYRGAASLTEF